MCGGGRAITAKLFRNLQRGGKGNARRTDNFLRAEEVLETQRKKEIITNRTKRFFIYIKVLFVAVPKEEQNCSVPLCSASGDRKRRVQHAGQLVNC